MERKERTSPKNVALHVTRALASHKGDKSHKKPNLYI